MDIVGLNRLHEVVARATEATTIAGVARVLVEEGVAALGAAMGGFWMLDGDHLELVHFAGLTPAGRVQRLPLDADAPLAICVRDREPLWIEDPSDYQRRYPASYARVAAPVGCACLPLVVDGKAIGGAVFAFEGMREFTGPERETLVLIARQCAHAADRIRLIEAERAARLEAELLARRMTEAARRVGKLYELAVALSSARTPEDVAVATTRLGADATSAVACMIWMRDAAGTLRMLGSSAPAAWAAEWAVLPNDRALPANRVIATGDAVWVETPCEYERVAPAVARRAQEVGRVNPFVALPLSISGQRAGVLSFSFVGEHRFDPDERTFLAAIARSCEQAIERAQLYATEAAARAAAESASRAKDEFLAMLGHELRNPLAPIVTALDVMRLRGGDGARERSVIERQVHHLTRLVDDLLDIARITRGNIELRRTTDELIRAIEPAIDAVHPLLFERRHELTVDVPASGLPVDGDPARLSQVVRNLLANATKFTPREGHIAVAAHATDGWIELTVTDDGRGIAPELLPRVFEPFVQGSQAADRAGGGLGLGLAIVKSIVELHGGTIAIASPGVGTRVVVRLPRAPAARPGDPASARRRASPRSLRVLIVDDNVDAAELLGDLLRGLGHQPVIAHDAAGALAAIERDRPQLAILDIGLPGIDGYELARRLRANPALADMPVIALTGYGQSSDRERTRDAGFVDHVVKPIDLRRLNEIFERYA